MEQYDATINFGDNRTMPRIGNWEYTVETQELSWSEEVYLLYEQDPRLGPPSMEEVAAHYPPEQFQQLRDLMGHSIETGEVNNYFLDLQLVSGKSATYHVTVHPIKNARGEVFKLFGTVQDITLLIKTQKDLSESRQKYRQLVEVTSDIIWEVDDEGIYTYVSPKIHDILGYQPDEIIGRTPFVLMPPEDARRIKPIFDKLCAQGKPIEALENRNFHKDGRIITLETNGIPFFDNNGKMIGYRGVDRDITLRKYAEDDLKKARDELELRVQERTAELSESEEKYRNLVDNASELVVVVQEGVVKFINNKAEEITGYSKSELLLQPFHFAVHHEDLPLVAELFQKSIDGEFVPDNIEFRLVRKDGRTIWTETKGVLIHWYGKPATLGLISDITERKRLERERKDYLHRIMVVQEEVRKHIANELHDDTGQSLALMNMQLAALLRSGTVQDPKAVELLKHLEQDTLKAIESVRRFVHELRPVILDSLGLTEAIEQILYDYQQLDKVSMDLTVRGNEPELAEEIKLGFLRIAQEALNNSRKHSKATTITTSLIFSDGNMKMLVQDNGSGFNVDEATSQSSQKGSLGLITMKERADLIGADLRIESGPLQGTTVTTTIAL